MRPALPCAIRAAVVRKPCAQRYEPFQVLLKELKELETKNLRHPTSALCRTWCQIQRGARKKFLLHHGTRHLLG